MSWVLVCVVALGLVAAGFAVDRLLLRVEERGWSYYRKRSPESGSVTAAAFGPVFGVLQPARQIVTEEREHERIVRHDIGNEDRNHPRVRRPDVDIG